MFKKRIPIEVKKPIVQKHVEGQSSRAIAQSFNVSQMTVVRTVEKYSNGLDLNNKKEGRPRKIDNVVEQLLHDIWSRKPDSELREYQNMLRLWTGGAASVACPPLARH